MPPVRACLLPAAIAALAFYRPAFADVAAPVASPTVQITDYGIYCSPETKNRLEAPETSLGYIEVFSGTPEIRYQQQEVPARLGVSFGVVIASANDIPEVRIETWKPSQEKPEIWYTTYSADSTSMRGFTFDFKEELLLGVWRMEAWDGDTRLYSVEFDVVTPSTLPGIGSDCTFLS
jgi:hypothetical protein